MLQNLERYDTSNSEVAQIFTTQVASHTQKDTC